MNLKKIGIAGENLSFKKSYFLNENKKFSTASVIKIAIAAALFKKKEQKRLNLYKNVKLKKNDIFDIGLGDCGVLKYFSNKSGISLYNACLLMLALSDNTATNLVLNYVSQKEVNNFLNESGFKKTKLLVPKLAISIINKNKKYDIGFSTPREMLLLLKGVVQSKFLLPVHSKAIIKMMSLQQINHKIPRILPSTKNFFDPTAEIVAIASKTGELSSNKINNDVAIITTKDGQKLIIVIFTQGVGDKIKNLKTAAIDHQSAKLIANVALKVYKKIKS